MRIYDVCTDYGQNFTADNLRKGSAITYAFANVVFKYA